MSRMLQASITALLGLGVMVPAATARNDVTDVTLTYVNEAADDTNVLEDVAWHLLGVEHAEVVERFGPIQAKASTNAAFKRDDDACARAFLSAIIELQKLAVARGANGVIDIRSIAHGQVSEASDRFLCTVGNVVAHVELTGVPAKLEVDEEPPAGVEEGARPATAEE